MMTPAESTTDPGEGADFDGFYRGAEPRIRRALVAACGPTAGIEATAAAMQFGFERWDVVQAMDNPAGYLYRVGRNAARSRRKPLPAVDPDVAERYGFEPGLPAAVNRLSEHQRQAVLLVHAGGATLAAACVIILGGAIAVGTTRFGGRDGLSGTVAPGEWALVDDPDGVFVPPPGGASAGDEQQRTTSENAIWVHSVEPIGDGFLAVGDEMQGFAPIGAVWRSADGESWERLAHDDSVGALGISEDPSASGPSMEDVAARDRRVVIAGSLSLGRDPAVWWSDDLNE